MSLWATSPWGIPAAMVSFISRAWASAKGLTRSCVAHLRTPRTPRQVRGLAAQQIEDCRQNQTMAGAFALSLTADRPAAFEGIENCYYRPPNFKRVTWVAREMPTPFVGFAPVPGPVVSGFINDMQFRYAREIELPKPRDVCRIFLTGGSTAFSCGATSNDTTIGGYLERYLNEALLDRPVRCEVITAASPAWTSTHERILIENRLVELEPDLVISFSGHNDAFWSVIGRNVLWFRAWQDDYFFLLVNTVLASNSAPRFPKRDPGAGQPVSPSQAAERLARNVAGAHHCLATVGADYVFALQPAMEVSRKVRTPREQRVAAAVGSQAWFIQMQDFYREFRTRLQALERPGFSYADATTSFDGCAGNIDVFIDTCHFGDRGNDMIAQNLLHPVLSTIQTRLSVSSTPASQ